VVRQLDALETAVLRSPALPALALAARPDDVPEGTAIGEYVVVGKLGSGAMGHVFAATHPVIGKRVAIKVLSRRLCADPDAVERFVLEARAVNQIGHPNIVDVFAFGALPDGRSYYAMEWLLGESLGSRLGRERLTVDEAFAVLDDIARALEAAHAVDIVHRDLKPDNVFLQRIGGEPPRAKLLDFGLAKLTANDDTRTERTKSGVVLGTPMYMSPEQARCRPVDARTDVYAFGVLAYEMLLGRLPFLAESATEVMYMHISEPPPAPRLAWPTIPQELEDLLLEMLAKEPVQRPAIDEVRERLARARAGLAAASSAAITSAAIASAAIASAAHPVASGGARRRASAVVIAAFAAFAAALVIVVATRAEGPPPVTAPAAPPPVTAPAAPPAPAAAEIPAPPREGRVAITVRGSPRASIVVDATPRIDGVAWSASLSAGPHTLEITAPRRAPHRQSFDVVADRTIEIAVDLVRDARSSASDAARAERKPVDAVVPAARSEAGSAAAPAPAPPPPATDVNAVRDPFGK
jgi:serine/threonine-protein kinase